MEDSRIKAVVQDVIQKGKHGPYAVASTEGVKGTITFSLTEPVWKEKDWPEPGHQVVLADLRKKSAGWRAQEGRFLRPSDEQ